MFLAVIKEAHQIPEQEPVNEPGKDESYSPRGVLDVSVVGLDSDQSSSSGSFNSSSSNEQLIATQRALIQGPAFQAQRLHRWSVINVLKRTSARKFSTIAFPRIHEGGSSKGSKKKLARNCSAEDGIERGSLPGPKKPSWRNFDLVELAAATDNFSPGKRSISRVSSIVTVIILSIFLKLKLIVPWNRKEKVSRMLRGMLVKVLRQVGSASQGICAIQSMSLLRVSQPSIMTRVYYILSITRRTTCQSLSFLFFLFAYIMLLVLCLNKMNN